MQATELHVTRAKAKPAKTDFLHSLFFFGFPLVLFIHSVLVLIESSADMHSAYVLWIPSLLKHRRDKLPSGKVCLKVGRNQLH